MMRISACYIVKDEAAELQRSLASLREAVDEIVIVSTAADIGVAELASNFHAQLWDFPWQNDFSAARNYALGKVSGEIVIFLDADEYFFHPEHVRNALDDVIRAAPDFDIIMLRRCNFMTANVVQDAI